MTIRPGYAAAALMLLAVEADIALFVHDRFVRPHFGDSLAVVLVYFAVRAVSRLGITSAVLVALTIAFALEIGQYFHLVRRLGLDRVAVARVVLGTGFDPWDFAAYLAGAALVLLGEGLTSSRSRGRRWRRRGRAG